MTNIIVRALFLTWIVAGTGAYLAAQDVQVLYSFTGGADGYSPTGLPIEMAPGVFYGMNTQALYSVTSTGTFTILADVDEAKIGTSAFGQLAVASNGLLYGATGSTYTGGASSNPGRAFVAGLNGKAVPLAQALESTPLIEASDGNLYGILSDPEYGRYDVYRLSLTGAQTILCGVGSNAPAGPLMQANDGNLYGVTQGSETKPGAVFKVTLNGEYSVVATLQPHSGGAGGAQYAGALVQATNGLLYGAADFNHPCPEGESYLYSVSLAGKLTVLKEFAGCPENSPYFASGLIQASDGMLYGVYGDGLNSTIFRLSLDGSSYFQYPGGNSSPNGLTQGSDGAFYLTTISGGDYNFGYIERIDILLPKPLPTPRGLNPAAGRVGTHVLIVGQQLVGPVSVSFNGVAATQFAGRGPHYVVAVVPPGATTGPVTVATANGSGTTPISFTVK